MKEQIGIPVIRVKNLRKTYGKLTAVDDISFEVGRGEIFGIVGPNGAGKTTLFRMILEEEFPDEGWIEKDEYGIVGFLPQEAEPVSCVF